VTFATDFQIAVTSQRIVIPKRGSIARESAVPPSTKSRFLADKPGFGMTSFEIFWATTRLPMHTIKKLNFDPRTPIQLEMNSTLLTACPG